MGIDTVALIPARKGSKRVPDKNIRKLAGHPLIAYTITTAIRSKVFGSVVVSTDSQKTASIARRYGADVLERPEEIATDRSPDIDWVIHALINLDVDSKMPESYAILRPTSPFRTVNTIKRAMNLWNGVAKKEGYASLRAVEKAHQHPAKMWQRLSSGEIYPVLVQPTENKWHDNQYTVLPDVYVQNASLEIADARMTMRDKSISGDRIYGFLTIGNEGFDINTEHDFAIANQLLRSGEAEGLVDEA